MKRLAQVLVCLAGLAALALAETPAPAPLPPATVATPGMVFVATLRNGFSLRFDHRAVMGETSRLYTASGDSNYIDIASEEIESLTQEPLPPPPPVAPAPAASDVKAVIQTASDKHLLDADLIHSVIRAESGFNPKAVSPKGARGLMQLMPGTAAKLGVENSFDPQANVDGGTRYLRELLERYNGDLPKALAAYNAGPHRVEQYHGVPPYHETRAYVSSVIRDFNRKKLAARRSQAKKPATTGKSTASAPATAKTAVTLRQGPHS